MYGQYLFLGFYKIIVKITNKTLLYIVINFNFYKGFGVVDEKDSLQKELREVWQKQSYAWRRNAWRRKCTQTHASSVSIS
ncbi:hypothetical protein bcere0001_23410 [Bacillus cereus m1293]|nr:hypothetical protein bcere0001_23410 [Bacillus cereus m1293]